jgi:hypothetical protein
MFDLVAENDVEGLRRELLLHPSQIEERLNGLSVLHYAKSAEIVELLLGAGLDVDVEENRKGGGTPLHRAAQSARLSVVAALIEQGAEPNARGFGEMTPLHWLTKRSSHHADVVELEPICEALLAAGADPNAIDTWGHTPVLLAARFGHIELLRQLVSAGGDPRHRDHSGRNALHWSRGHIDCADWLKSLAAEQQLSWSRPMSGDGLIGSAASHARLHPDGTHVVCVHHSSIVASWRLAPVVELEWAVSCEQASAIDVAVTADGADVVVGWYEDALQVRPWADPASARPIHSVEKVRGAIAVHPGGNLLAVAGELENVHVVELVSGDTISVVDGGERTQSLDFSPNGSRLAVAMSYQGGASVAIHAISASGAATPIVEIKRAHRYLNPVPFIDTLASVRFAPDGRSLAIWETSAIGSGAPPGWRGNLVSFALDGSIRWETSVYALLTRSPRSLAEVGAAMGYLTEPAFSNDSAQICLGLDEVVLIIDAETGALIERGSVEGNVHTVLRSQVLGQWVLAGTAGLHTTPLAL